MVGFDGDDAAGARGEGFGHFAVARADFEPCGIGLGGKRLRDALPPRQAGQEMLAKFLTGHR